MRYVEFKNAIDAELRRTPAGLTWTELRTRLHLPYERPCPEWTKRLHKDIGLSRKAGPARAHIWCVRDK